MELMENPPKATRPSLYAAIKLARLVQHFRERLKARVKRNRSRTQASALCQSLEVHALTSISRALRPPAVHDTDSRKVEGLPKSIAVKSSASSYLKLLNELDHHATRPAFSLSSVAWKDELFLRFDVQRLIKNATIKRLRHVLDFTTLLLGRFRDVWNFDGASHQKDCSFDNHTKRARFILNLEHMLLCLQQAALQALIWHSLGLLEDEIHHWREHWQQQKQFGDSWFSEWPSGRRPLSTTWPWNIKPSLVILWGVCWMFYGNLLPNSEASGEPGEGNRQWQEQLTAQPGMQNYDQNTWLGNEINYANTMQPRSQPGRSVGAMMSRADPSATLDTSNAGKRHAKYLCILNGDRLTSPTRRRSAGNLYNTPITPSSAQSFSTSTSRWHQELGINYAVNAGRNIRYNEWTPSLDHFNVTAPNLQVSFPNSVPSPYAAYTTPTTDISPNTWSFLPDYSGSPSVGSGLRPPMQNNYPSPQRSEGSDRASSLRSSTPTNLHPRNSHNTPPTAERNLDTHHNVTGIQEPPRNVQGQIYCSHLDCSAKNLIFSRKCEWTKHMDKHTRPYVCEETGCEKIQGFTYSGGLLRHQREVHKQHGGPKTPKMCPHRDCKRSTGTGFSRKENLQEHLRRVHRGVGAPVGGAAAISGLLASAVPQLATEVSTRVPRSKRPRLAIEDDEGVDDEMGELQAQVKKLKKEAEEKDARLMMLESVVQNILQQGKIHQG